MNREQCYYCTRTVVGRVLQTDGERSRRIGLCRKHMDEWEDKQMERSEKREHWQCEKCGRGCCTKVGAIPDPHIGVSWCDGEPEYVGPCQDEE